MMKFRIDIVGLSTETKPVIGIQDGTTHISSSNEPSPIFEVQYYMEEGA